MELDQDYLRKGIAVGSRVSWALAQISCCHWHTLWTVCN